MQPTEELMNEHALVQVVLTAAAHEIQKIGMTMQVHGARFAYLVEFFRNFIDRCHHAKEEQHLFPLLKKQLRHQENGALTVMIEEHELGRQRINAIAGVLPQAEKGVPVAIRALRDNLSDYIEILDAHIAKENHVLFPLADRLLTAKDQATLKKGFDEVEDHEMGNWIQGNYQKLVTELADS